MKLFDHQIRGLKKIVNHNGNGAFYWEVGTGKTLAALKVFEHYKRTDTKLQLLVVCPISLIESAWIDDIKKFTTFSYSNLRKEDDLSADILLINYEALISKKFHVKLNRIIFAESIMCVLDESQKIKNHDAITTKRLINISQCFKHRILLSATPAPNNHMEYWGQMRFLGQHILGDNFYAFRNKYFVLKRGKALLPLYGLGRREMQSLLSKGFDIVISPDSKNQLIERMQPYCQFIKKRDVLDLPDEINVFRLLDMDTSQAKTYKDMLKNLVAEIEGQEFSVNTALVKLMKLRQLTGGFAYVDGQAIPMKVNPKMNELKEVVDEIGNRKILIFCQYKWEIRTITSLFSNRARSLFGETEDKDSVIKWFKETKQGILVAHPLSAGVGHSFNDCDYIIFYSLSYSYNDYYQSRGRIMRPNKKNNATYIHLMMKETIDFAIYSALKNKETDVELFRRILR